jgi:hypothetical protein
LKLVDGAAMPLGAFDRIRVNKSVKKEGHWCMYEHRKKSVRVWENLFLRTVSGKVKGYV